MDRHFWSAMVNGNLWFNGTELNGLIVNFFVKCNYDVIRHLQTFFHKVTTFS